jgi:N-acetyl-anhydromuramyl-L-alanine amidase AmpD
MRTRLRQGLRLAAVIVAALALTTVTPLAASAKAASESSRQKYFREAAAEFGVPEEILLGYSYNQSRWENHEGKPSVSGGYGLMQLKDSFDQEDGRGDPLRPFEGRSQGKSGFRADEAAKLINAPVNEVRTNDRQNIRAGAALMAKYAKEDNNNKLPSSNRDWYGTVARASSVEDKAKAETFADDVYASINAGATVQTSDGQNISMPAEKVTPEKKSLKLPDNAALFKGKNNPKPECPPTIKCAFVPAHYAQNDPADAKNYGNLDPANRPRDMKIKYIVVHDTEGSYQDSIDWFQNPASFVSAQYLIRSSDGAVTQMVQNKDVAWHAGNWYMNMHSIGVEHEGYAAEGATWYTEAMYRSSAKLVRYLADKYDIPLDREHIVGHEQYHGLTPARAKAMHNDPGPFWDWDHYMDLLHAKPVESDGRHANAVTIAPRFGKNQQTVQKCTAGTCTDLPKQSSNFVYLRTAPRADAPLLTDAGLHPDAAPGTKDINDWSAVATYGQRFAIAGREGDWTAVWFGGQRGWFYNPDSRKDRTAVNTNSRLVTPKEGRESVPVYGRPLPEASAFAAKDVPLLNPVELQYKLLPGQSYVAYDREATNDYYHVLTFDSSTAGEGEVVAGNEKYIPISYNHRQAFVKASDVNVQ